MNKITKSIKLFKNVILPTIAEKYRPSATQVISLFADRKIKKTKGRKTINAIIKSRYGPAKYNHPTRKEIQQKRNSNGKIIPPNTKECSKQTENIFRIWRHRRDYNIHE